jgi:hypothetical protein
MPGLVQPSHPRCSTLFLIGALIRYLEFDSPYHTLQSSTTALISSQSRFVGVSRGGITSGQPRSGRALIARGAGLSSLGLKLGPIFLCSASKSSQLERKFPIRSSSFSHERYGLTPSFRICSVNSRTTCANLGPSAAETHSRRKRSSSIPKSASINLMASARFSVL